MLWHDDFFTLQNGETESIFPIGKSDNYLIIQHPYFHFGSLCNPYLWKNEKLSNSEFNTPVYLNQFEIRLNADIFNFHNFLSKLESNWHLKEDESLYYETGFWSINIEEKMYMGLGINSLNSRLIKNRDLEFALCLSNSDSLVIITSGRPKNETILLSIYASNEILSFAEVVEPFRKTIQRYNSAMLLKDELLREENYRRFWFAKRPIKLNPVAYVIDREGFGEYKMLPILKNVFKRTRDPIIRQIEYLTGTTSGGFVESEYNSDQTWELCAEIWDLGSLSIVEFIFSGIRQT